jgi:hypothetical protein
MWDSRALQGSIQKTRCCQPPRGSTRTARTTASPPGLTVLSILVPSVVVPCREPLCRHERPGSSPGLPPTPRPNLPDNNRVFVLSNRQRPPAGAPCGTRRVSQPPLRSPAHATGTKPMKVVARWPLLPPVARFLLVSHSLLTDPSPGRLPAPFEVGIGTLLCFASPFPTPPSPPPTGPCGPRQMPLLGISKDRPSVVCSRRVHSHRGARRTRRRRCPEDSHRSFGIRGATADPRSVSAVLPRPDGLRLSNPARVLQRAADHGVHDVLKRSAKTVASSCLSCPSKFSPRPQQRRRHSRGTSRVERHQPRLSPKLFTADLSSSPFPAGPPLHR